MPPGLQPGDSFRLLFVTSDRRDATSTDIHDYNNYVVEHASRNEYLAPHADRFRTLAATVNVKLHKNTATEPDYGGVAVYWVDSSRVADDYADLYDSAWYGGEPKNELGQDISNEAEHVQVWTGAEYDGLRYQGFALGQSWARIGLAQAGAYGEEISAQNLKNDRGRPLYGLSPVFTIATSPAESDQD